MHVGQCGFGAVAGDADALRRVGHPWRRDGFYADACAYCDYRTLCGVTENDTDRMRIPVTDKEAAAAMQKIMNGETEAETDEQMDTGTAGGD